MIFQLGDFFFFCRTNAIDKNIHFSAVHRLYIFYFMHRQPQQKTTKSQYRPQLITFALLQKKKEKEKKKKINNPRGMFFLN